MLVSINTFFRGDENIPEAKPIVRTVECIWQALF